MPRSRLLKEYVAAVESGRIDAVEAERTLLDNFALVRYLDEQLPKHPKQLAFHKSPSKSRWLLAGNKSGKTTAACAEMAMCLLGIHPYREVRRPPVHAWILGVSGDELRETAWPMLISFIPESEIAKVYEREMVLKLNNGSVCYGKSADQKRERLQSANIDYLQEDEEVGHDIHIEASRGLISTNGETWGAMTPLKGLSWVYSYIFAPWRDKESQEHEVFTMSMDDNPVNTSESIEAYLSKIPNPAERKARRYGAFVPLAGRLFFDPDDIDAWRRNCYEPARGFLKGSPPEDWSFDPPENLEFIEAATGQLKVWEEPESGHQYLVEADVAEAIDGGDYSTAYVLNRTTGEYVANWWGHIPPEDFPRVLYHMGWWYNNAYIAVEANNHGYTVLSILQRIYSRLYQRISVQKARKKPENKLGWYTSSATRMNLLDTLYAGLKSGNLVTYDLDLITEMGTFILDEKGRPDTPHGCHDDRIFAAAIGAIVNEQWRAPIDERVEEKWAKMKPEQQRAWVRRHATDVHPILGSEW